MEMYDEAFEWVQSQEAADLLLEVKTLPRPMNEYLPAVKRRHIVSSKLISNEWEGVDVLSPPKEMERRNLLESSLDSILNL